MFIVCLYLFFTIVRTNLCAVLLKIDIIWTLLLICNIRHQEFRLKMCMFRESLYFDFI